MKQTPRKAVADPGFDLGAWTLSTGRGGGGWKTIENVDSGSTTHFLACLALFLLRLCFEMNGERSERNKMRKFSIWAYTIIGPRPIGARAGCAPHLDPLVQS